eukprot:INCI15954.2.p1 GENE.INCI15954.2~~INCI15954.2.p1  ORF type:complete len:695 (-),score=101.12 INCI15954.2:94-2178(-)
MTAQQPSNETAAARRQAPVLFHSDKRLGHRPVESVLPALVAIWAAGAASRHWPRQIKLLGVLAKYSSYFLCFLMGVGVERARWQQFPLPIGIALLTAIRRQNRGRFAFAAGCLAVCAMYFCRKFPLATFRLNPARIPGRHHDRALARYGVGTFDYQFATGTGEGKAKIHEPRADRPAPIALGRCFYPTDTLHGSTDRNRRSPVPYLYHRSRGKVQSSYIKAELSERLRNALPLERVLQDWHCVTIEATHCAPLAQCKCDCEDILRPEDAGSGTCTPSFASAGTEKRTQASAFPVVVFSHGLKATREMYSSLALRLASLGCIVLCVEHLDGSAAAARFPDGTTVAAVSRAAGRSHSQMKLLKDTQTEDVYNAARMDQARVRAADLRATLELLEYLGNSSNQRNDGIAHHEQKLTIDGHHSGERMVDVHAFVAQFAGRIDSQRYVLAGHSFGGCTGLTFLADEFETQQLNNFEKPLSSSFACAIVFDPAMCWIPKKQWPLFGYAETSEADREDNRNTTTSNTSNDADAPAYDECFVAPSMAAPATLAIFSQEWYDKGWFWPLMRNFLRGPKRLRTDAGSEVKIGPRAFHAQDASVTATGSRMIVLRGSTHVSLSDMGILFPNWLGKRLNLIGTSPPERVLNALNECCVRFLVEQGILCSSKNGDGNHDHQSMDSNSSHEPTPIAWTDMDLVIECGI